MILLQQINIARYAFIRFFYQWS